jgi:hypothetical protein
LTAVIVGFLAFGALFGLATYSRRHLFSEGPTRPPPAGPRGPADGRVMWVLICTPLWPLMALTGAHSLWRLWRRARVRARAPHGPDH